MIYPDVNIEEWCKRYRLEIRSHKCLCCGDQQITSMPWASKHWRGLIAPTHGCGESYRFSVAVEISTEGQQDWKNIYSLIE